MAQIKPATVSGGTLANRPSSGDAVGQLYYVSDSAGRVDRWDGTQWTQTESGGANLVTTASSQKPKFVAADFPACTLMINSNSLVRSTADNQFIDLASGVYFRNVGDDTWTVSGNLITGVGAQSANENDAVSGTIPALGDKHLLMLLVAPVNSGSQQYFEVGDVDGAGGAGAWVDTGGQSDYNESWVTLDASNFIGTANPAAAATGAVVGAALTFNRDESSEILSLRRYRVSDDGTEDIEEGDASSSSIASAVRTATFGAWDQRIKFNAGDDLYIAAMFQTPDARILAEATVLTALRWMVANPGELWPGFMNFSST